MDTPFKFLFGFSLIFLLGFYTAPGIANYRPLDQLCDGLPKLAIGTMPGTCLGLVANAGNGAGFIKPRKAIEVPGHNQLLVTDMGGWAGGNGILWLLTFSDSDGYREVSGISQLARQLTLPHDIKLGPDNYFYLGEADKITRFKLHSNRMVSAEVVIDKLPYDPGNYLHPLSSFVFLPNNDLLVNVGSRTDNCRWKKDAQNCDEITSVGLRRYRYDSENSRWSDQFDLYASGLRNSVALLVHSSGTILQGENSTDLENPDEPYEEINIIREGGFYGWPYCFNRKMDSGFIDDGCAQPGYIEPYSLMPPHVAPLDMLYYDADLLPIPKGSLLVSWHGYRVIGHRLVSYRTEENGLPTLSTKATFHRDPIPPAQGFTQHNFAPEGGSAMDAQANEIITHWDKVPGLRPEGAPVGLLQLRDGSLLIVDDKNKALLRLSAGEPYMRQAREHQIADIEGIRFDGETKRLLMDNCSNCHTELTSNPGELLNRQNGWLESKDGKTLLEKRLTNQSGFMPPMGKLADRDIATILKSVESRPEPIAVQ